MRDYAKEYQWQTQHYDEIKVRIDKELGIKFREKLKKEKKTIAGWLKESIEIYVKK